MPPTTESRVRSAMGREGLDEDCLVSSHLYDDLGLDSLDTVELAMALEEEFSIEIDDDDAEKWQTVLDVVQYIDKVCPAPAQ